MEIKQEIELIRKKHSIENIMNPNADETDLEEQENIYFN